MVALSAAIHSNRTLVWGVEMSFILDQTREEWGSNNNHKVQIAESDHYIDCSTGGVDSGGGPFDCFFEPLSICTIADVSQKELLELSINAYNDSSRVFKILLFNHNTLLKCLRIFINNLQLMSHLM